MFTIAFKDDPFVFCSICFNRVDETTTLDGWLKFQKSFFNVLPCLEMGVGRKRNEISSLKPNITPKNDGFQARNLLFHGSMFRCYVSFEGEKGGGGNPCFSTFFHWVDEKLQP